MTNRGDFTLVDARLELFGVLDRSGVDYIEDTEGARFRLKNGGREWNVACRCRGDALAVCAVYPFDVADEAAATEIAKAANAELMRGCLYFEGATPVMRTFADVFDEFTASEAIVRAIEYNASATLRYYAALMACAE